jgi:hypothetical protein
MSIVDFSPVPGVCGFGMGLEEKALWSRLRDERKDIRIE